ncbi:MAG: proprotein convertase P-domain-containing protein, partial [Anaerolineales bacterium]|nr:proprotein convertase P-domain-containing protein [Anaerolineales bacterium]
PQLLTGRYITVSFIAAVLEGDFVGAVTGTYSLDGGDNWHTAVAAPTSSPLQKVPTFVDTETEPNLLIPGNSTVSVTLTFTELTRLVDLEVGLEIEHLGENGLSASIQTAWPPELGGTETELFDELFSDDFGFSKLTFRDDALRPISNAKQVFTTTLYTNADVPQLIDDATANTITSTLEVLTGPTEIETIAVVGISGTHSYVGDLTMWLVSPEGTAVLLIEEACGDTDNFNLSFSDEAFDDDITCPLDGGNVYRPIEPLALFEDEDPLGTWSLVIQDDYDEDGGELQAWGLRISGPTADVQSDLLPLTGVFQPNQPLAFFANAPSTETFTLTIENSGADDALLEWVGLRSLGREHQFVWDTFASGLFGESDNVVFRIEAYPQPTTAVGNGQFRYHSPAPSNQWPSASSTSTPFSVRGTQVRVLSGTQPVADALVYRLPAGQTGNAQPIASETSGEPFTTAADGYLQGRGVLNVNDQIVALLPISTSDIITFTNSFSLYHTSAPLSTTTNAPALTPVTDFGVQELTVSPDNPLTLFDITISLEWDARNDAT